MQILNIFHVLIAIAMIAFILIQKGAGATAGAAFGSGASGTVFGSRGAGNFLTRSTWVLATSFCLISLTMAVMASRASISPETDLGVIANSSANTPVTEELIEQTAQDMPNLLNDVESSDMPSIDALTSEAAEDEIAGDLPAIEEAAATDDEDL
jgi:preprotein translocase subunit SecG